MSQGLEPREKGAKPVFHEQWRHTLRHLGGSTYYSPSKYDVLLDHPDLRMAAGEGEQAMPADTAYLLLEYVSERRDTSTGAWVNNYREQYTYDALSRLTGLLAQQWSGSVWENSFRWAIARDSNGLRSEWIWEWWTDTAWVYSSRYLDSLNAKGRPIVRVYQQWISSNWFNRVKTTLTYDSLGYSLDRHYEEWIGDRWQPWQWRVTTYDSLRRGLVQILTLKWDGSDWMNESRILFSPTDTWYVAEETYQAWDSNSWVNEHRELLNWDQNRSITEDIYQEWTGTDWINVYRWGYTNDSRGNPLYDTTEEWIQNTWRAGWRGIYTWQELVLGVSSSDPMPASVSLMNNYPNPFNPSTMIPIEVPAKSVVSLRVFNILGQTVATLLDDYVMEAGRHEINFNGASLTSGVYYYRLTNHSLNDSQPGNISMMRKMVLIK